MFRIQRNQIKKLFGKGEYIVKLWKYLVLSTVISLGIFSTEAYAQSDLDTVYNDGTVKEFIAQESYGTTELQPYDGSGEYAGAVTPDIPDDVKYISDRIDKDESETILGSDDRSIVSNTTVDPYKKICLLVITFPNGETYLGSGNLISSDTVLTAGHCIYDSSCGGWATKIAVYPGNNGTTAPYGVAYSKSLMSVSGWTTSASSQHDIGAIRLDRNMGDSVGWFGLTTTLSSPITLSGYHGDLSRKMGTETKSISRYTTNNVYYTLDSTGGSSGSGVYNSSQQILAVHAYGSTSENFGTRVNEDKFSVIKSWIGNDGVEEFVTRLYTEGLGRQPDASGLANHIASITSTNGSAANTILSFFTSAEYTAKNTTDEQFVNAMYKAILGRDPDSSGKEHHLNNLKIGASRKYVIRSFVYSDEFSKIYTSLNVKRGDITLSEARDQNLNITEFVYYLYKGALGREPDIDGLNNHTNAMNNGRTAAVCINAFFTSAEYTGRNRSNSEFVEDLYNSVLRRNSDSSGKQNWVNALDSGKSRLDVMKGFINSDEFTNICTKYGITKGSL